MKRMARVKTPDVPHSFIDCLERGAVEPSTTEGGLSATEEDLVTILLAEFSEHLREGADTSIASFLARCPNDVVRAHFEDVAAFVRLAHLAVETESEEPS